MEETLNFTTAARSQSVHHAPEIESYGVSSGCTAEARLAPKQLPNHSDSSGHLSVGETQGAPKKDHLCSCNCPLSDTRRVAKGLSAGKTGVGSSEWSPLQNKVACADTAGAPFIRDAV